MATPITTYAAFWPSYLREHAKPETRRLHYARGQGLTFLFLGLALAKGGWWWVLVPLAGYGFAWAAHFGVEKNRPATFRYPLWSLASDYRMFFLWLSGAAGAASARGGGGVITGAAAMSVLVEVIALEEQGFTRGFRQRIGEAIAEIEISLMTRAVPACADKLGARGRRVSDW